MTHVKFSTFSYEEILCPMTHVKSDEICKNTDFFCLPFPIIGRMENSGEWYKILMPTF